MVVRGGGPGFRAVEVGAAKVNALTTSMIPSQNPPSPVNWIKGFGFATPDPPALYVRSIEVVCMDKAHENPQLHRLLKPRASAWAERWRDG